MKLFVCLIGCLIFFGQIYSQEYRSAFGIKSGYPGFIGLDFKKPLGEEKRSALELMAGTNFDSDNRFICGQLQYQRDKQIGFNSDYYFYYGLGPTVQYYTSGGYISDSSLVATGGLHTKIDVFLGFELIQPNGKLNLAADIGPALYLLPAFRFGIQFNVAIRLARRD
ncbi:MAG: hypothetical protein HYU67_09865 [Flavobacteriia bacterium]|nr:hypothetical protein [Flavobacteriia bacterium]